MIIKFNLVPARACRASMQLQGVHFQKIALTVRDSERSTETAMSSKGVRHRGGGGTEDTAVSTAG